MSYEINPVLAGTYDAPGYTPAHNIASITAQTSSSTDSTQGASATSNVSDVDDRRYTKFDHSDTDAGTASMSFGDFLDMINPLEHIPVVSSVYRSIAGETINPVSRVVGDTIYGGLLGPASAIFSGISAVADASLESQTGKDSGGLALAALFGPDDNKPGAVQLAAAGTAKSTAPAPAAAPVAPVQMAFVMPSQTLAGKQQQTPSVQKFELAQAANTTPIMAALQMQTGNFQTAAPQAANAPAQAAPSPSPSDAQAANAQPPQTAAGGIPLNLPKSPASGQPFGGVMGPANTQAQDLAIALSEGSPTMRMGHTIYTNRLVNGQHPLPPMLSATPPSPQTQGSSSGVVGPPPVVPPQPGPASDAGTGAAALLAAGANPSNPMTASLAGALQSPSQQNQLPPGFTEDMMMKTILSRYGTAGGGQMSSGAGSGSMVNVIN